MQTRASVSAARTPKLSPRLALEAFRRAHYSANRMSVAVLGRGSLDELQQLVVPLFAAVPNWDAPTPAWSQPVYPAARLGRAIAVAATAF